MSSVYRGPLTHEPTSPMTVYVGGIKLGLVEWSDDITVILLINRSGTDYESWHSSERSALTDFRKKSQSNCHQKLTQFLNFK